ncbi:MAG: phospho-sugar mutase, partial [Opitutae bacterium]
MTKEILESAVKDEKLLISAQHNINELQSLDPCPYWIRESLDELINENQWEELNDRFHSNLAFGTGGMRGRTIGKVITSSERGTSTEGQSPDYAAVGSNTLNELTLLRANKALFEYVRKWMQGEGILEQPRLVVAYDVRHFSQKFANLVAKSWIKMGGYAMMFDGPRSTPQLSFTVRQRYAHAGVVITASHNPYHDNGFKAYFGDGAQLVPPHDRGVVSEYKSIRLDEVSPWLEDSCLDHCEPTILKTEDDMAYKGCLEDAVLNPELLKKTSPKIVFTPIHGTGAISAVPALWDHGVQVALVDEQGKEDPNFSTVKSPNPENAEALALGIKVANKTKSPYVLGSDPDCDRIGVAVAESKGNFSCLSGNQVASILAEYRLLALKSQQLIREGNESGFAMLKTFVTSPLIEKIAQGFGVRCVNTQTGFKWMAQKIGKYEEIARVRMLEEEGIGLDFDSTELFTRIDILSRYSTCTVLAAEESYGYLPQDLVRDKDGNASSLAIAEAFAFIESIQSTPLKFLDTIYQKYGYHLEKTENLYFEGAEGSATISRLVESYRQRALESVSGIKVTKANDYSEAGYVDEDNEDVPRQNFIQLFLENGFSVAIRPSGTEPKIKYYLFGCGEPNPADLAISQTEVSETLAAMGHWLVEDARERA